jgi:uncharacterized protein
VILPDVNVLVFAHRADSPLHQVARTLVDTHPLAVCPATLNGFLRLVTVGPFKPVTPPTTALAVVEEWLSRANTRVLTPGQRHWRIYFDLCRTHGAKGNAFYDIHLAALAIEHGADLWSFDRGFARFPNLRWRTLTDKS